MMSNLGNPAAWNLDIIDACVERCAEFGDPKCLDVSPTCGPCEDCLVECGLEVIPPLDPNAVVGPLL